MGWEAERRKHRGQCYVSNYKGFAKGPRTTSKHKQTQNKTLNPSFIERSVTV